MQVVVFGLVGIASTLTHGLLYLLFWASMPAQLANLFALLLTAVANTAANRRLTSGSKGLDSAVRHQAQGLVIFLIGLGVTSGARRAVDASGTTHHGLEVVVLEAANLFVTVMRFLAMRTWVYVRSRS